MAPRSAQPLDARPIRRITCNPLEVLKHITVLRHKTADALDAEATIQIDLATDLDHIIAISVELNCQHAVRALSVITDDGHGSDAVAGSDHGRCATPTPSGS